MDIPGARVLYPSPARLRPGFAEEAARRKPRGINGWISSLTQRKGIVAWLGLVAVGSWLAFLGGPSAATGRAATASPTGTVPTVAISSPRGRASIQVGSRLVARFTCAENGSETTIATCRGTVASGHAINTNSAGNKGFTVVATDTSGHTVTKTIHYTIWSYVNPLVGVASLQTQRIDMGVDYAGAGPILAIGKAKIIFANNNIGGPESCWGKTCAPAGSGMVVYRLLDGPFTGKYVYAVEAITIAVKAGQVVRAGQKVATLHDHSPNLEIGWAAGHGPETLAVKDGHQCTCIDPGGWSTVEGRNFDNFLVWLGAPGGYLQSVPSQQMSRGWPSLPGRHKV